MTLDVTKAEDRIAVARHIESQFGKLDILINNAGIGPVDGLIGQRTSESSQEELQNMFNINLFSLVALTHELLPLLKRSEAGRIVNLSSLLGSLTLQSGTAESPGPVTEICLQRLQGSGKCFPPIHLAAELEGTNIKVNSVHPWMGSRPSWAPMQLRCLSLTEQERALPWRCSAQMGLMADSFKIQIRNYPGNSETDRDAGVSRRPGWATQNHKYPALLYGRDSRSVQL